MLFFHLQKETKLLNFFNRKTLGPVILGGNSTPAIKHSCCKRLTEPAKERRAMANAKEVCPHQQEFMLLRKSSKLESVVEYLLPTLLK